MKIEYEYLTLSTNVDFHQMTWAIGKADPNPLRKRKRLEKIADEIAWVVSSEFGDQDLFAVFPTYQVQVKKILKRYDFWGLNSLYIESQNCYVYKRKGNKSDYHYLRITNDSGTNQLHLDVPEIAGDRIRRLRELSYEIEQILASEYAKKDMVAVVDTGKFEVQKLLSKFGFCQVKLMFMAGKFCWFYRRIGT